MYINRDQEMDLYLISNGIKFVKKRTQVANYEVSSNITSTL
jgi:hypothetical protein